MLRLTTRSSRIAFASALCLWPGAALSQSPQVGAFIASTDALIKAAEESINDARSGGRFAILRQELTQKLRDVARDKDNKKTKFRLELTASNFLCDVRAEGLSAASSRGYLQTLSTRITKLAQPAKIDSISSAIGSIFSSYSLDAPVDGKSLDETSKAITARCQTDLFSFEESYFGLQIRTSEGKAPPVAVFAAFTAVVELFKKLVEPFVVEGGKMLDERRREAAIRDFLSDGDNVDAIQKAGNAVASYASKHVWNKRLRLAGAFATQAAAFRSVEVDLGKSDACKNYLDEKKGQGNPLTADRKELTDEFLLCWRDAWQQIDAASKTLLTAAAEYDQLADTGNSDNAKIAFANMTKQLKEIGTGKFSIDELWSWTTRVIAFAEKVEAAASKENRAKLKAAIDDLVNALSRG